MSVKEIRPGVFFSPRKELPRGRHALDRAVLQEAHRERLMAAFAELVAAGGLSTVTVADVVARAGVSRAAFYTSFGDIASCADAAYQRFIEVLLTRLVDVLDRSLHWHALVHAVVRAYLGTLQADLVVARAMQLEMDAAGKGARTRRRLALQRIADALASRHAQYREEDPTVGPLPAEAHLGLVYAVRQLACDRLDAERDPDLLALVEPAVLMVAATVAGAAHVDVATSQNRG